MKIIKLAQVQLGHLCEIKTNFPDADFWLQRKGDENTVGTPTKEFKDENIGIKVKATDVLDPGYLFYMFQYLHSIGELRKLSRGMTRLQSIRVQDVRSITLG